MILPTKTMTPAQINFLKTMATNHGQKTIESYLNASEEARNEFKAVIENAYHWMDEGNAQAANWELEQALNLYQSWETLRTKANRCWLESLFTEATGDENRFNRLLERDQTLDAEVDGQ